MKKLLFILAAIACMLSCRSVKNEGLVQTHHYGVNADTLSAVVKAEGIDSTNYYHGVIDSLCNQLREVRQKFRDLYVRDSINTFQYRGDSVSVKDTTWMEINADGSITYHHYREKYTYTSLQVEKMRQQIIKESQATVDSLIEKNERQQQIIDSISQYRSYVDSVSLYRSKMDSMANVVTDMQKTIIEKNSLFDKIKLILGSILFCLTAFVGTMLYLRFFRRK